MSNALIEGVKEGMRVVALAVVSWLLTDGVLDYLLGLVGVNMEPTLKAQVFGLLTVSLRAVDKWLHERGQTKGLTQF